MSYVFSAYGKKLPDVSELVEGFHFREYENVLLKDLSTGNRKKVYRSASRISGASISPAFNVFKILPSSKTRTRSEVRVMLSKIWEEKSTVPYFLKAKICGDCL